MVVLGAPGPGAMDGIMHHQNLGAPLPRLLIARVLLRAIMHLQEPRGAVPLRGMSMKCRVMTWARLCWFVVSVLFVYCFADFMQAGLGKTIALALRRGTTCDDLGAVLAGAHLPVPTEVQGEVTADQKVERSASALAELCPVAEPVVDPHAMYMRFFRSLWLNKSPDKKAPPEVIAQALHAKGSRHATGVLYEQFLQARGDWLATSLMLNVRQVKGLKKTGKAKWWDKNGMLERYSAEDVQDLIARKEKSGSWMWHPDWPQDVEKKLYRCWDSLEETEQDEFHRELLMSSNADLCNEGASHLMHTPQILNQIEKQHACNELKKKDLISCSVAFLSASSQLLCRSHFFARCLTAPGCHSCVLLCQGPVTFRLFVVTCKAGYFHI